MLIPRKTAISRIPSSEITSERLYRNRRQFLETAGGMLTGAAAALLAPTGCAGSAQTSSGAFDTGEEPTPYEAVTGHNNFYEFGTAYEDAAANAHRLVTDPWTVEVDGLVSNPRKWDLDDLLKGFAMEDRVYRMRCVEGWSMVIPWYGFPMAGLVNKLEPLPGARYVRMETLHDPGQMPGQRRTVFGYVLDWPYVEGLRMDEAMNPLTLMAVGVYGKEGPNQNGAPLRLVVPWKYGFKGIKSIVRISFVRDQPVSSWQDNWPEAYGFFSNVNPEVPHPRYSQARERRIGEFFTRPTLMFNGYTEHVAHLYEGMDLARFY